MKLNIQILYKIALWMSILGVLALVSDLGFVQSDVVQQSLRVFYFTVLGLGVVSTATRYIEKLKTFRGKVFIFDALSICFTLWIFFNYFFIGEPFKTDLLLENPIWVKIALVFTAIRELSEVNFNYKNTSLNPAQLFVLSFVVIIFIGTLLLLLPNATHGGLSFIDALFTTTSAVCVTGLIVVDTGTYFTHFGHVIIAILIQIGGLGILTFASYFSYFFKGGSTYDNQLMMNDLGTSNKLGEVFSTLKNVLLITFGIEFFSAILIYTSINSQDFTSQYNQIFFAIFHAISAFCNAGFSTLTNSLYEAEFKFNYYLQLIIIFTFVLGGLGFPIVVNIINFFNYRIRKLLRLGKGRVPYKPWILKLNSRLTLITTATITVSAFIIFYILEYNNTLAEHGSFGKIVTALFGACTPRTAGFNTIDTSALLFPTTMMVFLLMWIGASPASTGGGIKTSTFLIACLNFVTLAKGKTKIEIFRREIADISVRRAFATISLSLMIIGIGIMLISVFESKLPLIEIGFECFSAYSTVGLSLGITAKLSDYSRLVIIVIMFVGRVSMLTVLIAVFKKAKHINYKYPVEEITIN